MSNDGTYALFHVSDIFLETHTPWINRVMSGFVIETNVRTFPGIVSIEEK